MEVNPYLKPYTITLSKWIEDLSVRDKTKKLLEEIIGLSLHMTWAKAMVL
jgi:hypothetical protein